jgi:hypothetical protein
MRLRFAALASATLLLLALSLCDSIRLVGATAEEPSRRSQGRAPWTNQNVELASLFDAVIDTVSKHFFDETSLKQHHWAERAQAMRSSVLASSNAGDAVRQINALLAELGASHTALYTPNDYEYYILLDILGGLQARDVLDRRFWGSGPYYPGIGIFTRQIGEKSFIDGVLEGSPADKSGLKFGDEILSVDGRPYSRVEAFDGKIGTSAEVAIRRTATAEPERLSINVTPIRPVQAFATRRRLARASSSAMTAASAMSTFGHWPKRQVSRRRFASLILPASLANVSPINPSLARRRSRSRRRCRSRSIFLSSIFAAESVAISQFQANC